MTIHEPWRDLIAEPVTRDHYVQVYRDERVLVEAVSLYAGAALGRSEAVLLVATAEHGQAFEESLVRDGYDVAMLKGWGQLQILDAEEVLSRFMVDGSPDEQRFKSVIRDLVSSVRASGRFRDVNPGPRRLLKGLAPWVRTLTWPMSGHSATRLRGRPSASLGAD